MNSNCQYQLKFNEGKVAQPRAMNNPGHRFQNLQYRREQIDEKAYKFVRQNPQQWQNPIPHNQMQHLKNPPDRIQNTPKNVPTRTPTDTLKDTPAGTPTGTPMGTAESNFKLGNPQNYFWNSTGRARQVNEANELRVEEQERYRNYEMNSITRTPKHAPKDLHESPNYSAIKEYRQKANDVMERVRQLQQKVEPLMRNKSDSIEQANGFEGRLERKINRMETLVEKLKQNLEINMEKKLMEMEQIMEEKYREVKNKLPIQR